MKKILLSLFLLCFSVSTTIFAQSRATTSHTESFVLGEGTTQAHLDALTSEYAEYFDLQFFPKKRNNKKTISSLNVLVAFYNGQKTREYVNFENHETLIIKFTPGSNVETVAFSKITSERME